MFPGETVLTGATHPGTPLEVLQSAAGFYIGHRTEDGAPYSRESHYFGTRAAADSALQQLRDAIDGRGEYAADDLPFMRGVPG
jgi:hypothetical protein